MADKKYRIIQIIDTLEAGGAEKVLVTLSNIFFSKGHDVTVITTLQKGALANQLLSGIIVKSLERRSKWNLADMSRLVKWCRDADIIHVHSTHNLRYVYVASKFFFLNKRIFFHHHFGNIEIDTSVHWNQRLVYPSKIGRAHV